MSEDKDLIQAQSIQIEQQQKTLDRSTYGHESCEVCNGRGLVEAVPVENLGPQEQMTYLICTDCPPKDEPELPIALQDGQKKEDVVATKWEKRPSGLDWSYWDYGSRSIEPVDLDYDHWETCDGFQGQLEDCKRHIEGLPQ